MKSYIGVRAVEAEPMTYGEYIQRERQPRVPYDGPSRPGYLVKRAGGTETWVPKDLFEKEHLPLADGTRITRDDINLFLGDYVEVSTQAPKTTLVHAVTASGWEEFEASSCVPTSNYDENIGRDCAVDIIKQRLWKHLGFVLQWARHGLKTD